MSDDTKRPTDAEFWNAVKVAGSGPISADALWKTRQAALDEARRARAAEERLTNGRGPALEALREARDELLACYGGPQDQDATEAALIQQLDDAIRALEGR